MDAKGEALSHLYAARGTERVNRYRGEQFHTRWNPTAQRPGDRARSFRWLVTTGELRSLRPRNHRAVRAIDLSGEPLLNIWHPVLGHRSRSHRMTFSLPDYWVWDWDFRSATFCRHRNC